MTTLSPAQQALKTALAEAAPELQKSVRTNAALAKALSEVSRWCDTDEGAAAAAQATSYSKRGSQRPLATFDHWGNRTDIVEKDGAGGLSALAPALLAAQPVLEKSMPRGVKDALHVILGWLNDASSVTDPLLEKIAKAKQEATMVATNFATLAQLMEGAKDDLEAGAPRQVLAACDTVYSWLNDQPSMTALDTSKPPPSATPTAKRDAIAKAENLLSVTKREMDTAVRKSVGDPARMDQATYATKYAAWLNTPEGATYYDDIRNAEMLLARQEVLAAQS